MKDSPTKLWPSLMFLLFVAMTCFADVFLAFMEEMVRDWEQGSFIIEMGVLVIAMLLPTMCLSFARWHKKAAQKDAHEACDEKKNLMHGRQDVTTIAAGIRQAGLACIKRMTMNRQLQDMKKSFPTKLRPSLMLLFFVALTCFVDVLVALMEELIFKTEPHSFMTETQLILIALLLPTMCLSLVSWHKTAAQKDAHKDCDGEKTMVYDQQDDATVAQAEHALQNVMDQGNVDMRNAAFSAAVAAVAQKYASANSADVHAVTQRRAKQLELVCQAAEEQRGGTRRHRQQQGQLQQQQQGRQKMQQQWAPLPPQAQPGVGVQEPQLVMQSHYRKSAPRRCSSDQPLYVKAGVKPGKSGAGRVPHC